MNATEELRRMLDKFERDLCHAGCGAKCGTHEERRALIDGVKDRYAQAITATLGDDAKLCHATEANYRQCKYGTNRGWCDDAPFLVWDDTGHLFITMGGLKTWDVTDDAKAWFVTLGSMTATVDDALSLLDEMNEQGRIEYADYSQLHDAIAATLDGGECKWVWVESWTDTTDGRECDYAHWMPDCGCWSEYDHRFSDFDDYAEKPTGIAFCERCGKAVKR